MGHSYDDIKTLPVVCVPLSESAAEEMDAVKCTICNAVVMIAAQWCGVVGILEGACGLETVIL